METKKTPQADLENKRTTFFLLGFAVVLSSFFVALEWRSPVDDMSGLDLLYPVFIENEFTGNAETPGMNEQIFENPIKENEEIKQETVYEDFNIVDEAVELEKTEELQAQIQPDSSITQPKTADKESGLSLENLSETVSAVYTSADVMPQFPGGTTELIHYIYQTIQYPSAALKQRIQGRVWCSFTVNKDGSVSDVRLEQGVYIFLDEEAVRVLKTMPAWKPGLKSEKAVSVKVYLPIVFRL
ncbi:protein TonB [Bacteroidia bacterium]|nr:protein TonB [Bacteroidia bacterium]GHV72052.1 protein TonB [Bacteroidia bacterium]